MNIYIILRQSHSLVVTRNYLAAVHLVPVNCASRPAHLHNVRARAHQGAPTDDQ